MYGKEPGAPMREYEGYEREMAAFRAKGLAFDDAMVDDDPTLGEPGARRGRELRRRRGGDADHLGNIEERWEEEDAVSYDAYDKEEDEDDVFDDWNGRDVDADAATVRSDARPGGEASPRGADRRSDPNRIASGAQPVLGGHADRNVEDIHARALRVLRSADAGWRTRSTPGASARLLRIGGRKTARARTMRITSARDAII